jgi:4-hydroxy-3-polyprenylbenzoate decarboxylase
MLRQRRAAQGHSGEDRRVSTPTADPVKRIIIGITGASGAVYGVRALQLLHELPGVETHLVMTSAGQATVTYETGIRLGAVRALADFTHSDKDIGATIASGSFRTAGMLVAPCSIKTLSGIATSHASGLVVRAADVVLKERRPLVLLLREKPLHAGHLRIMQAATEAGAVIAPPVPAFYARPRTLEDVIDHTVARALELFDINVGTLRRWEGLGRPDDVESRVVTPLHGHE